MIGEHRGLALYTLGQRSGLRVGGRAGAAAAPWYVAAKDARATRSSWCRITEHPLLMSDAFEVEEMPSWLDSRPAAPTRANLRMRRQDALPPERPRTAGCGFRAARRLQVTLRAAGARGHARTVRRLLPRRAVSRRRRDRRSALNSVAER